LDRGGNKRLSKRIENKHKSPEKIRYLKNTSDYGG